LGPFVTAAEGRLGVRIEALLPDHADEWIGAIKGFVNRRQEAEVDSA
jgi:hypothetical protein